MIPDDQGDESDTDHLLGSPANAERLLRSIRQADAADISDAVVGCLQAMTDATLSEEKWVVIDG